MDLTKAFNFPAFTEEEILATMPPTENEDEDDVGDKMVRGRNRSAPSDQVSFKVNRQLSNQIITFNFSDDATS